MEEAATAVRILQLLRDGPCTAQALAKTLQLDVSSVRRHLESLAGRDLVASEDRIAGRGRPKKHHFLTEEGWESFPRDYPFLAAAFLDGLQRREGRAAVLDTFADVAAKLASSIDAQAEPAARIEQLHRLYNDLGFQASVRHTGQGVELVQRNCPFLKLAKHDPEALCDGLDENLMRIAVPEAEVRLHECMATGDNRCRHTILIA